jgi:hypothetical protein
MSFLLSLVFFFHKMEEQEGGTDSALKLGGDEGGPNNVYTHVSKCKNDKIKFKKN